MKMKNGSVVTSLDFNSSDPSSSPVFFFVFFFVVVVVVLFNRIVLFAF